VASAIDITCLKETEAALRGAKEQTELYLDLMGHDINNLNHIAVGYLEMALGLIEQGQCLCSHKKPGIGLYLVRTFIKQFKGKFRIEDRVPCDYTKGCCFVVMLPAADDC